MPARCREPKRAPLRQFFSGCLAILVVGVEALFTTATGGAYPSGDVHVLERTRDLIRFEVATGVVWLDTLGRTDQDQPRIHVSFRNATAGGHGSPLPERVVWLAVPPGTRPVVARVETAEPKLLARGVTLASDSTPVPVRWRQIELAGRQPPVVGLGEPVFYRRFQLVPVRIRPLRYESGSARLEVADRVTVTLRFERAEGGQEGLKARVNEEAPEFLRRLVLNPSALKPVGFRRKGQRVSSGKTWSNVQWFRIEAARAGLVAIPWEELVAAGADSAALAEGRVAVFESDGRPLPEELSEPEPSLKEMPYTLLDGDSAENFGPGKSLVYLALGPTGWRWDEQVGRFRHWVNPFTTGSVAWLAVGGPAGQRMPRDRVPLLPGEPVQETVRLVLHFEEDRELPDDSGTEWVWRYLTPSLIGNFSFKVPDLATPDSVLLRLRLAGLSDTHHTVAISVNGQRVRQVQLAFKRAQEFELHLPPILHRGENRLRLYASERGSIVGVDWFEVEATCRASVPGGLVLQSPPATGAVALQGVAPESLLVVDVGKPQAARLVIPTKDVRGRPVIRLGEGSRFLVWPGNLIQRPISVRKMKGDPRWGWLRGTDNEADYMVVGPRTAVESQAVRKLLDAHSSSGVKTVGVALEDVYDQFAWGRVDPTAIRNFLRYAFEAWRRPPRWILLVGDATYDLRNVLGLNGDLVCPSHESRTTVSDDWFTEWTGDRVPDATVGRLPVKGLDELEAVVAKILAWQSRPPAGLWRATTTFVADDAYRKFEYVPEDEVFERDTERLSLLSELAGFDIRKIYLNTFRWNAVGNRPGAREAFLAQLNGGTVFVNYLGHANWNQIAHETLFQSPDDFDLLKNGHRLPLGFAGTCETARLDDPHFNSVGELALLKPDGGFGAWIGCARWTMHGVSASLDEQLVTRLFAPENRGKLPIGEALLSAKLATGFPDQTEAVFLLGDPLACLPLPTRRMRVELSPDTLDAHHRIWLRGTTKRSDSTWLGGESQIAVRLYDAGQEVRTGGENVYFSGPLLYEGVLPLDPDEFGTSFFVTADTLRGGNSGRLICVAWALNGSPSELILGHADSLLIRPDTLENASERDTTAPSVRLAISRGLLGEEGGVPRVERSFELVVTVEDSVGDVPARGLCVWIKDVSEGETWEFGPDLLQWQGPGESILRWEVSNWRVGTHQLRVCAEDAAGNRRCDEWTLRVMPTSLALAEVVPYPNPADREMAFLIDVNQEATVVIDVFTLAGRRIWRWRGLVPSGQTLVPEEGWCLVDADGDPLANGVYLFRVRVKSLWMPDQVVARIGKLAVAR